MSEDLGHGIIREWLEDERIMVLKMPKGAGREAIDIWYETTIDSFSTWDRSRPFLALYDSRELGFSSNLRNKAMKLRTEMPNDLHGRAGVVLEKGVIGHLLGTVAQAASRGLKQKLELKIFTDYDKALEWLKERL